MYVCTIIYNNVTHLLIFTLYPTDLQMSYFQQKTVIIIVSYAWFICVFITTNIIETSTLHTTK